MKNFKFALLTGAAALLFASAPLHLDAATSGQWSYAGFTQWHPQDGKTGLGVTGTQCYFCKPEGAAPPPPPPPPAPEVAVPKAAPPVVAEDRCLDTPKGAPVDRRGCWVLKNLNFRFNSAVIESKDEGTLNDTINVLKQNPKMRVEIQGHTDNIGKAPYNKKLSQKRAEAVVKYLAKKGVQVKRMLARGYGLEKPIASNATEAGRAENRRVELKVIK